jgi:hypothetical protein
VTTVGVNKEVTRGEVHLTEVEDDQAEVAQCSKPNWMVLVKSKLPNRSPVTVTLAPPLRGILLRMFDTTGASVVKSMYAVPATAPTVTLAKFVVSLSASERHCIEVELDHDAVGHGTSASWIDTV